jgi:hypothetical protein
LNFCELYHKFKHYPTLSNMYTNTRTQKEPTLYLESYDRDTGVYVGLGHPGKNLKSHSERLDRLEEKQKQRQLSKPQQRQLSKPQQQQLMKKKTSNTECRYGSKCHTENCTYSHTDTACRFKSKCHTHKCTYVHPNTVCRYGPTCRDQTGCLHRHPKSSQQPRQQQPRQQQPRQQQPRQQQPRQQQRDITQWDPDGGALTGRMHNPRVSR